jgi:arylsulfatase A-like enzyme
MFTERHGKGMSTRARRLLILSLVSVALVAGCEHGQETTSAGSLAAGRTAADRPNILLIVWDTVRADRLSLYDYDRPTTPYLDQWAKQARVYDNCISVGSTTVPSHAAMFTGLLPSEHGASNEEPYLANDFVTLAELLRINGYPTYLFSENPHICGRNNFTQGFDAAEYPWSPKYRTEALRITRRKVLPTVPNDELPTTLREPQVSPWLIKAVGELAQRGVEVWLQGVSPGSPFFIFLNYMEAHRPLIPARQYRERMMTPEQVAASYHVDYRWETCWLHSFGLREYTPEDIALIGVAYDAVLLELDQLLHDLLEFLRSTGRLENTIVVLVSDHGEHLGEHHLFDHQFSVYEPLMRVPLVVHYPPRFKPGRDARPVTNLDLFPTLLGLAGIEPPVNSKAVSLLTPQDARLRLGEYPAVMVGAFDKVREYYPDFDPTPWNRSLRAYYDEPYKLIQASDGRHELYQLDEDPNERRNLIAERPQIAQRLAAGLQAYVDSLQELAVTPRKTAGPLSEDERRRLEALGYVGDSDADDAP